MSMKSYRSFSPNLDYFTGKSVLITGATGSFGSAMLETLLHDTKATRIIAYSRDELKQHDLQLRLRDFPGFKERVRFFIGDVRDQFRLEMALHGVDYVIHAAALKQITTAEYNPFECIHTNIIGAENVIRASLNSGVTKVIALSTDKAANPINLYGASKLASDKLFIAASNLGRPRGCIFSVVRYGNVIGSRGSVIPVFQKLIADGADHLPLTDQNMTRFWITLRQGVAFVLSNIETMVGGENFIPKIPSMKILDLVAALAPDLPHKIVGVRPGEKLHETLVTRDDAINTVELADRYVILPPPSEHWPPELFAGIRDSGELCPADFQYTSDSNTEWLGPEDLSYWLAH